MRRVREPRIRLSRDTCGRGRARRATRNALPEKNATGDGCHARSCSRVRESPFSFHFSRDTRTERNQLAARGHRSARPPPRCPIVAPSLVSARERGARAVLPRQRSRNNVLFNDRRKTAARVSSRRRATHTGPRIVFNAPVSMSAFDFDMSR